MAVHTGTTGSITFTIGTDQFTNLYLTEWSLSIDQQSVDATSFSPTNNWETKLFGTSSATGSCSGYIDDTTPIDEAVLFQTPGTTGAFVLGTASTGIDFSFTGHITNFSPTTGVNQVASFSATFAATGAVTVA